MNLLELLDYLEPPVSIGWNVSPTQALEYLKAKGLKASFSYADLSASEHYASFTVAKMMDTDMLADVKTSLEEALAQGTPFKQWADSIIPTLQSKGWWGREPMVDPATGQTVIAQLGSPGRLQTIFRTNLQSAYAVGAWEQIKQQEAVAPFLMYDAVDDFRTRPEHAARDGVIQPISWSGWKHGWYPPCGWNCRCTVIQMSQDELDELGLEVSPPPKLDTFDWLNPRTGKVEKIPKGTDPGFQFNPGEKRLEELTKLAKEKAGAMPPDMAKAALAGIQATQAKAEALTRTVIADAIKGGGDLLAASKAAERAAVYQISKALQDKTPYLSKAIEAVKKTTSGKSMTATELLAVAKEKAAKAEASAFLGEWKKAKLAGKKPSAKAQQAFDALPEEAQGALSEQLDGQIAATKAQIAAQAELADIAEGKQGATAKKVLADFDTSNLQPTEALAQLKVKIEAQKASQNAASAVSNYKKALLAGKTPSEAQAAAFKALPPEKQAKLLADVEKAKAAAAPPPAPSAPPPPEAAKPIQRNTADTQLDPDSLVQTGPQGGSNPGGEYTDTSTGVKWYVKHPDNVEALRNEVLAARLYKLAGVETPDVRLIQFKGKPAIASRMVDGLRVDQAALSKGRVAGVQEHFTVDAWLSNWDVVGPDFANTKLTQLGTGLRIDPGGALRFRAQGGMKGSAFGNEVLELESMRNTGTNPHAAKVFRHVTQADIEDGARRILAIPEDRIAALVQEFGPVDPTERKILLQTLLNRRRDLAKRYPNAVPKAPEPPSTARVTAAEQQAIEASRANGVTINTDAGAIEDHQLVVATFTDVSGKLSTRVTLKLRPDAGKALQNDMGMAGEAPELVNLAELKTKALQFLRGVGALAKKGEFIREDDIKRARDVLAKAEKINDQLWQSGSLMADPDAGLKVAARVDKLQQIILGWQKTAVVGQKAVAFDHFDLDALPAKIMGKVPTPKDGGRPWASKNRFDYQLADIKDGRIHERAATEKLPAVDMVREITIDGARVRYIPYAKGNSISAEGYMQIDIPGTGVATTEHALKILDQLGIPTERSTPQDRLELYLERIASIRTLRNPVLDKKITAARKLPTKEARNDAMLQALNEDAGFDMRTSPNWNPEGKLQAFGHGRITTMRPDIAQGEIDDFEKDYHLYTNPEGWSPKGATNAWPLIQRIIDVGGQFASQMDRVRRGVPSTGSSPEEDHRKGGGNYIFTRVYSRKKSKLAGVYWRARQALRTDAFSYGSDLFGEVKRDIQEQLRGKSIAELKSYAPNVLNETNFRDSLSIFDDLERIVLNTRRDYDLAITYMRSKGYATWPDGRALEDVFDYLGSPRK